MMQLRPVSLGFRWIRVDELKLSRLPCWLVDITRSSIYLGSGPSLLQEWVC